MKTALRMLRLLQVSMLFVLLIFIALPELIQRHPTPSPSRTIFFVITGLCVWMILGTFFLRKKIISKAEQRIVANPEDKAAVERWKRGQVIGFACCEALGLYGLMLRFLGFSLGQVAPFYIAGVSLMLYLTPRPPLNQL